MYSGLYPGHYSLRNKERERVVLIASWYLACANETRETASAALVKYGSVTALSANADLCHDGLTKY